MIKRFFALLCACLFSIAGFAASSSIEGLKYAKPILPNETYRSDISTPESLLNHKIGDRLTSSETILDTVKIWAEQSERAQWFEYAKSHEGRPLVYLMISSPEHLAKRADIQNNMQRLRQPGGLSDQKIDKIIDNMPGIAWMAYSIHGNESSGSDAALAAIYYLLASDSAWVKQLLNDMVILIDPNMNPDGRARFEQSMREYRGAQPSVDNQSMQHTGYWPYGRTNHYWFDLNRDFTLGVHPETLGRVKAINEWNPLFMVDAHEQGSMSNFLFSPPREPINKTVHPNRMKWLNIFAADQAEAFDKENWPYFNGEWFEDMYPGYSSFVQFKGTTHILYEQPRIHEDGILGYNGVITSYAESVDHQFTSTLVNLKTYHEHYKDMLKDYVAEKKEAVSKKGSFANQSYVVKPDGNHYRWQALTQLLDLHEIEYGFTEKRQTLKAAESLLRQQVKSLKLPAGSLVIPLRQADARLVQTLFEFDTEIDLEVLKKERESLIRGEGSIMYDVTAWNMGMMYDLDLYTVPEELVYQKKSTAKIPVKLDEKALSWLVDAKDDAALIFAAKLMERGVKVRVVTEPGQFGQIQYSAGSIAVNRYDQKATNAWWQTLKTVARDTNVDVHAIQTGLGLNDLPDLGGARFALLQTPKIAVISGGLTNPHDVGAVRHLLDQTLGIRHSLLDESQAQYYDLRRYNLIILTDRYGEPLPDRLKKSLADWTKNGGTLLALGTGSQALMGEDGMAKAVKTLSESLKEPESAQDALYADWLIQTGAMPSLSQIQSFAMEAVQYPWDRESNPDYSEKLASREDAWLRKFMPQGAFVQTSVNTKHWLASGVKDDLPVLVSNGPVLLGQKSSESIVRLGQLEKLSDPKSPSQHLIWAKVPEGYQVNMRLSGLLWPEARKRLAGTSYMARERLGQGQIIHFAQTPVFRSSTLGTMRLFMNAVVLSPGMGTELSPPL